MKNATSPTHQSGELSGRWACSEATLERWRCEGIGPVFMKLHGRVLYRIEDIENYEAQCMRISTSQTGND